MAKRIIPTVNEKLLEKYIRHSVYLEQLKNGEASLISRFLGEKVFPQLRDKLIKELGRVKGLETLGSISKIPAKRLTRMLLAVRKTAQAGAVKAEKMLVKRLVNVSKFEAQWNANTISKTVPLDLEMTMPSNEVLKNLVTMRPMNGHKLGTWMAGYSTAIRVAMTKQIKIGIATGESLPTIGARINKALNWKGKQAQFIARTAVSNVVHQAKEEVFKKNKDLVRKVQWVATLDDRTSLICINYDGKMFDVGYGERPPAHFNCRSTIVPVTPSWQEYGVIDPPPATRASMNGAVPAKMTYKQWLKKQPKAVQVKVLGKKRAELYRSGQVKIDKFVGKDMRPLTLKQLARREGLDLAPAPPAIAEAPPITVSKVGTTFAKTTTKEFQDIVTKQIDAYPENVKAALNERQIKFKTGSKLTEIHPDLIGQQPRGWPAGTTWDSVEGLYNTNTRIISIAETYRPIGQKTYSRISKSKIKAVLNHETGHGFDRTPYPKGVPYSQTAEFKSAYINDVAYLSKSDKNNLRYFLQKKGGRGETFAELFADEMGLGVRPDIRNLFPNCTKYVEKVIGKKVVSVAAKVKVVPVAVKTKVAVTPVTKVKSKIISKVLNKKLVDPEVQSLIKDYSRIQKKNIDLYTLRAKEKLASKGLYIDVEGNLTTVRTAATKKKHFPALKSVSAVPAPPITVSKVGTTFAKTTTKDIQNMVTKHIDSYPENVKVALNKNGTSYNIGNSLTEINPLLKGKHPIGWSKGSTWDNVGGMYNMNTKSVSIAETYLPRGQKFYSVHSKNQIRRMLNHETGHAFDSSDITGMIYSNQHKFKAAYTKDVNALSRTTRIIDNNLQFFMQPGSRGRSEVFADVFGDIMGGGATEGMKKFFPNSAKYIEDLLK